MENSRRRIILIFAVFGLAFLVIVLRVYELQVIKAEKFKALAKKQHKKTIKLSPKRGTIYDRKREVLAISIDLDSVYADLRRFKFDDRILESLSHGLNVKKVFLEEKLKRGDGFTWIKRRIAPEKALFIKEMNLPGLGLVKESKRFYPFRNLTGHLLGFVGYDSIGLEGLELAYNDLLLGKPSYITVQRDAKGRALSFENMDSRKRKDLVLTIDKFIQYTAEKALSKAIEENGAKGGFVIVMEPKTGEVLAMANHPPFNSNSYSYLSPSLWRNRAICDSFEPGSTFKVILAAALLEEGLIKPNEKVFCENGSFFVGKNVIHDVHKYGWLSFDEVIKFSSNIGASKLAGKLGKRKFNEYIKDFGFGEKTGINLPGEAKGIVKEPEDWSDIELRTIAFGQGITVSGIQMIRVLSAIANGGFLVKPHVIKEILEGDKQISALIPPNPPLINGGKGGFSDEKRVMSVNTAEKLKAILKKVLEKGGTGEKAQLFGYSAAGKTGTAQKVDPFTGKYSKDRFVSSFMGFAPVEEPKVAIFILIDEPKERVYGGVVAAPLFREIAQRVLNYWQIPHENPPTSPFKKGGLQRGTPEIPPLVKGEFRGFSGEMKEDGLILPDLTGLTIAQVLKLMRNWHIEVKIFGSGRVVNQIPQPGQYLKRGDECQVWLQPLYR